jgi:hypothetical protein
VIFTSAGWFALPMQEAVTMITRARADELAPKLDLEERRIDLLRRDVAEHVRKLKHAPPDERRAAAAELGELHRASSPGSAIIDRPPPRGGDCTAR